jgi:putative transcriptional regulator
MLALALTPPMGFYFAVASRSVAFPFQTTVAIVQTCFPCFEVELVSRRFQVSQFFGVPRQGGVQPGTFLVAAPSLRNNPFNQTVVFVLQNDSQGTFGAVINRPADQEMIANWSRTTGLEITRPNMIQGGPLNGPIVAIHQNKPLAEVEICDGVCLSVEPNALQQLTRQESPYRIVLGIAGWGRQQLSSEMDSGLWYHLVVDPTHVFDDHSTMWENFVREFGRQTLSHIIGQQHFPSNPALN